MPASLFPPVDLEEALLIAKTIFKNNSGKPMRRLTIFDALGRSPDSGPSRTLITASSGYGLTQGGYTADMISLTDRGRAIVELNDPQSRIDAVSNIKVFAGFFEHYKNSTLPSNTAAIDFLVRDQGLNSQNAQACLDVLLKCGEQVALIQEISNTKRIVSPDHALEKLTGVNGPKSSNKPQVNANTHTPILVRPSSSPAATMPLHSPAIHLDIQVHISPDASSEQIDQIFASMAKHLFKGQ